MSPLSFSTVHLHDRTCYTHIMFPPATLIYGCAAVPCRLGPAGDATIKVKMQVAESRLLHA